MSRSLGQVLSSFLLIHPSFYSHILNWMGLLKFEKEKLEGDDEILEGDETKLVRDKEISIELELQSDSVMKSADGMKSKEERKYDEDMKSQGREATLKAPPRLKQSDKKPSNPPTNTSQFNFTLPPNQPQACLPSRATESTTFRFQSKLPPYKLTLQNLSKHNLQSLSLFSKAPGLIDFLMKSGFLTQCCSLLNDFFEEKLRNGEEGDGKGGWASSVCCQNYFDKIGITKI